MYKNPSVFASGCNSSRGSWPLGRILAKIVSRVSFVEKFFSVWSIAVISCSESKNWRSSSRDWGACCWVFEAEVDEPAATDGPAVVLLLLMCS